MGADLERRGQARAGVRGRRAGGTLTVRAMRRGDWGAVRAIYAEGIAAGTATFERRPPAWAAWNRTHLDRCRLVAQRGSEVLGWVALAAVSERCVYAGVAEVSVYVRASARRRGVGRALLRAVIEESERAGIWTLQGGVFPENVPSIALLEACGFRTVGYRERLGAVDGAWRDVLLLERRSTRVGMDAAGTEPRLSGVRCRPGDGFCEEEHVARVKPRPARASPSGPARGRRP